MPAEAKADEPVVIEEPAAHAAPEPVETTIHVADAVVEAPVVEVEIPQMEEAAPEETGAEEASGEAVEGEAAENTGEETVIEEDEGPEPARIPTSLICGPA